MGQDAKNTSVRVVGRVREAGIKVKEVGMIGQSAQAHAVAHTGYP